MELAVVLQGTCCRNYVQFHSIVLETKDLCQNLLKNLHPNESVNRIFLPLQYVFNSGYALFSFMNILFSEFSG